MHLHLHITGVLLAILAMIHFFFPRYFNWKQQLGLISTINRQMMYVHTFFIFLVILGMGLLCLTSANELLTTKLGRRVCLGIGVFWTARLFIQFFGYSSELWRGKRFETAIHILFSIFWIYFSTVFILAYAG